MFDDRRKYLRFDIPLKVEFKASAGQQAYSTGMTKDVSREGIRMVSNDFNHELGSSVDLQLAHPAKEEYIPASGSVVWKKNVDNSWHVGFKLEQIDAVAKGDILGYAYDRWLDSLRHKNR